MSDKPDRVDQEPSEAAILNRYTRQLALYTGVLAMATVATVAGTIWIGWSTKELRDFAEQQAKDMASQVAATNDALKIAGIQAEAATKANELAKTALFNSIDTAKKQLRAYLIFGDKEFYQTLQKNMEIHMELKNVGSTPAYDVRFYVGFGFFNTPSDETAIPEIIEFEGIKRPDQKSISVGSQGKPTMIKVALVNPVTDGDIRGFRANGKILLLQGWVAYRDIYGDSHSTKICLYKEISQGSAGADNACPKLNEAD